MCLIANLLGNYDSGWGGSLQQAGARAEQLLVEAIESDPHRSLARSAMGFLRRLQNRLIESRIEFETAIALGANDEWSPGQLGWTLLLLGQPEAALRESERHLRLSPRDPNVWGTYVLLGWCRLMLSQVDGAIDLLIKSRAANPRPWGSRETAMGRKQRSRSRSNSIRRSTRWHDSARAVLGAVPNTGNCSRARQLPVCTKRVSPTSERAPRVGAAVRANSTGRLRDITP